MESPGSDHSQAVNEGNRYLQNRYRVSGSLAISADVPQVTSGDIHQVIRNHECVTLVPNATGEGTNAVLTSPPNAITCQFGVLSLERHVASADTAGLTARIVNNANIAHDIDHSSDLEQAIVDLRPSFTRDYLQRSGIAARLNHRGAKQAENIEQVRSTASQWT